MRTLNFIHPSRSAPLCTACAHFVINIGRDKGFCAHPSTPRDVATGDAVLSIQDMRSQYLADSELKGAAAHCGPGAALYAPMGSAAQAPAEQPAAHVLQPGANLAETTRDVVTQSAGEPVGSASVHESGNQLGMSGRIAATESRVD